MTTLRAVGPPRPASPLIGIVTHELRAETDPAWAPMPGRSERDLAPPRLALRLSLHPGRAGGRRPRRRPPRARPRRRHRRAARPPRRPRLQRRPGPRSGRLRAGPSRGARPGRRPRVRRVRARPPARRGRARSPAARHLSRHAGAERLARRDAAPAPPGRHRARPLQGHEPFVPAHPVVVSPGSLLHRLSDAPDLPVNSFHHQAADAIGAGLDVCAQAPDGTVEALWDPAARFCLGVQWHAELLTHDPRQAALLAGLVDAARGATRRLALVA